MRNVNLILLAGMLAVSGIDSSAMAADCTDCTTKFVLDEDTWNCLINRRLPDLEKYQASPMRFTLDQDYCSGASDGMGKTKGPGRKTPPVTDSNNAPTTYKIDRQQLQCLRDNARKVTRSGNAFVFDFATCKKAQ